MTRAAPSQAALRSASSFSELTFPHPCGSFQTRLTDFSPFTLSPCPFPPSAALQSRSQGVHTCTRNAAYRVLMMKYAGYRTRSGLLTIYRFSTAVRSVQGAQRKRPLSVEAAPPRSCGNACVAARRRVRSNCPICEGLLLHKCTYMEVVCSLRRAIRRRGGELGTKWSTQSARVLAGENMVPGVHDRRDRDNKLHSGRARRS